MKLSDISGKNKKILYLKDKINELTTPYRNKNIRQVHRGICESIEVASLKII
jgi:hypothetical protein